MADLSFCILREKMVVNDCDGKKLGHIIDISFNSHGHILGIIVPGDKKFIKSFSAGSSISEFAVYIRNPHRSLP